MDVSIVIVSYNASAFLKECIDSIFKFTEGLKFEVIIVDNASPDNSVEVAKSFGNKVVLIENKENKGFATGVNTGLKAAKGKYILVLNPDVRLLENSIQKVFSWMESHGDTALASCQLLDSDQKLLPNGGYSPTLPRVVAWGLFIDDVPGMTKLLQPYHPNASFYKNITQETPLDWVTGSFMFIRAEAIAKAGTMDEAFFMYGEEVEWMMRFGKTGYKIMYLPFTSVIHHERGSQKGLPKGALLGEFKGLKYIYGKYEPVWKQLVLGTILDVAAFIRVLFWLIRLKPQMARIYLEALLL